MSICCWTSARLNVFIYGVFSFQQKIKLIIYKACIVDKLKITANANIFRKVHLPEVLYRNTRFSDSLKKLEQTSILSSLIWLNIEDYFDFVFSNIVRMVQTCTNLELLLLRKTFFYIIWWAVRNWELNSRKCCEM